MQRGAAAEARAAEHLQDAGLVLIERNYRCRGGEIDLVMRDGGTWVFVEVRERNNPAFGGAAASITPGKQARLIRAARHYLSRHRLDAPCRFDAVLIDSGHIEWLRSAFEAPG